MHAPGPSRRVAERVDHVGAFFPTFSKHPHRLRFAGLANRDRGAARDRRIGEPWVTEDGAESTLPRFTESNSRQAQALTDVGAGPFDTTARNPVF
jgi:hypothetical protein